jgi:hypothetical protein
MTIAVIKCHISAWETCNYLVLMLSQTYAKLLCKEARIAGERTLGSLVYNL